MLPFNLMILCSEEVVNVGSWLLPIPSNTSHVSVAIYVHNGHAFCNLRSRFLPCTHICYRPASGSSSPFSCQLIEHIRLRPVCSGLLYLALPKGVVRCAMLSRSICPLDLSAFWSKMAALSLEKDLFAGYS